MINCDLSNLYNTHILTNQSVTTTVGEPTAYEAADFAHLPFAEELADLVCSEVNRQYTLLHQWVSRVGFIHSTAPSVISLCFPLLILAKDANDDTPNYVVNMMDFMAWDDKLQKLIPIDDRRVLSIVCYDKQYNTFIQKACGLCQNAQNFNLFLCEEYLMRCLSDQPTVFVPSSLDIALFKVQQVLFLLLQKHQEDIKQNYALKSYQYADNIVQSMSYAHKLDVAQLKAYVEQVFDGKPLPLVAKQTQSHIPLQSYFDWADGLPLYLARASYHRLILAMLLCLDRTVPVVEINPTLAEPDLSTLETFIKDIFRIDVDDADNAVPNSSVARPGVEVSLAGSQDLILKQNGLSVFYELMNGLYDALVGYLADAELAQKTVHALMYRTCLNNHYYPQAQLFCRQVFANFGYHTTVVSFNDNVESYIDHLLNHLPPGSVDADFASSVSIQSLIDLLIRHKVCHNNLLLKDLMADILSRSTHAPVGQMLHQLLVKPLIGEPDYLSMPYTSTIKLDAVDQEAEVGKVHRLLAKGRRGEAFFVAAPVMNAKQVTSLYNLFTHVASINPLFLYQLPAGMDYFDKSIIKHMRLKLKGQPTHYPFTPIQAKLLGVLQEKTLEYYNEDQLLKPDASHKHCSLSKYLYLNSDKSVVGVLCQHTPIKMTEALTNLVAAKKHITKKLADFYEANASLVNRLNRFNISELKNTASMSADASFFNSLKGGDEYLYLYRMHLESGVSGTGEPLLSLDGSSRLVLECCQALLYGLMPVYIIVNEQQDESPPTYLHQKLNITIDGIPSMYFNRKQLGLLYPVQLPLLQAINTPAIWQLCLTGCGREKLRLSGDYVVDNVFGKASGLGLQVYKLFVQVKSDDVWEHRDTPDFLKGLNCLTQKEFSRCFGDVFDQYQNIDDKLIVSPTTLIEQDLGKSLVDAVV